MAIAAGLIGIVAAAFALFPRWQDPTVLQSATPANIPPKSIAVLPFRNLSEDKDNAFFADGISEELLNLLCKVPQLKVAARTSSFSFKDKPVQISEIARELRVAYVLEGSVRRAAIMRITVQLIRAAEGYHVWSETYDPKIDDIFKIQDEIAGGVVRELKVTLLGAVPRCARPIRGPTPFTLRRRNSDGNSRPRHLQSPMHFSGRSSRSSALCPGLDQASGEFYRRNRPWADAGQEGYARAREAAEKALAIEPEYALAHAGLGRARPITILRCRRKTFRARPRT